MSTEALTIIGTIIVVNIALFAWLRSDIRALRDQINELRQQMTDLRNEMAKLETRLRDRIAKLEGLLEGLRESSSGRGAA